MDYYFTSDVHFFHKRILDFCRNTRGGCTNVQDMNEMLIHNWNSQVKANDIVYHLGDFSFGTEAQTVEVLKRLNGQKHFIMGNHDSVLQRSSCKALLSDLKTYKEIRLRDTKICLFHFPMWEWHQCHRGSFHLFGHVHENYRTVRGKSLNVGIDARPNGDMRLWTVDEIFAYMQSKPVISHHDKIKED